MITVKGRGRVVGRVLLGMCTHVRYKVRGILLPLVVGCTGSYIAF